MARKKPVIATIVEPTVVEPTVVEPTVVEPTVVEPTVVEPTVVEPANVQHAEQDANLQLLDSAVIAAETAVAHIDATATITHEIDDIATIRGDIKERTTVVKACAVKLMLWYIASMPKYLELDKAIGKGRTLAYAKCGISDKASKDKTDSYGPVRGEFDGLRQRLLHTNTDPRTINTATDYETFNVSVILENVPTVAAIRKDKRDADKAKAVETAVAEQAMVQVPVDVSEEMKKLINENIALHKAIDEHNAMVETLNSTVAALNATIADNATVIMARNTRISALLNTNTVISAELEHWKKYGTAPDKSLVA